MASVYNAIGVLLRTNEQGRFCHYLSHKVVLSVHHRLAENQIFISTFLINISLKGDLPTATYCETGLSCNVVESRPDKFKFPIYFGV